MALRYSAVMPPRQTLPFLWLISDARNDHALERALAALPRGSGFVFRHYHLAPAARRVRFRALRRLCRARGIVTVWAGTAFEARSLGAEGCYGAAARIGGGPALLRLATAHSLREVAGARRADGVLLSPVFATRSHPGARPLGPLRFLVIARQAPLPVIALGGMTARGSRRLPGFAWAAIDGLSHKSGRIPLDS
ncbi:thiamine phosphate synthase [Novosphingobium flavum]|uniref:Thiamine phosphate synthase n=1 Tax=Novosphingobium flavum TaxID=1778672 RepID=A0A7X1FP54_9SPHN|nr:thiamine phosphate synthase [Novosphingobium flavum]MBC2664370.1 thiamine phosphate synthase [Novosphingobium flavum]